LSKVPDNLVATRKKVNTVEGDKMKSPSQGFVVLVLVALSSALIRFQCSQLVVERLDPLVNPGMTPSTHVHQIVGGVSAETSS